MTDDYTVSDLSAFGGSHAEVGVGHKFESFDDGNIAVQPGDVVVFDDPDAGLHVGQCELIHSVLIVAYVKCVYAVDYDHSDDAFAVELGTSGPLGRISVDDHCVGVLHDGGPDVGYQVVSDMTNYDVKREARRLIEDDDAEMYRLEETHLGRDGVPDDLWQQYDESDRSGPGCRYCRGEGRNGSRRIEVA